MAKKESQFQKEFLDKVRDRYPGCVILKNDSSYIQGFPDWTILYRDKWAVLEMKKEKNAKKQPNQEFYVNKLDGMSFSRFTYPENASEVMERLDEHFNSRDCF